MKVQPPTQLNVPVKMVVPFAIPGMFSAVIVNEPPDAKLHCVELTLVNAPVLNAIVAKFGPDRSVDDKPEI